MSSIQRFVCMMLVLALTGVGNMLAKDRDHVEGELIIKLTSNAAERSSVRVDKNIALTGLPALDALNRQYRVYSMEKLHRFPFKNPALAKKLGMDRTYLLKLQADQDLKQVVANYKDAADVAYAQLNMVASIPNIIRPEGKGARGLGQGDAELVPNDPTYPDQWGLNNTGQAISYSGGLVGTSGADINAQAAWDIHTGSSSIILAIIDTGVDYGHPEFAGRTVGGFDFVNNDSDPADDNGHGTSCAGIAAAAGNNSAGVAGVNWNCQIMGVKVLDAAGSGSFADVASGITWAADNGADVLSLSLGGGFDQSTADAVNYAHGLDVVVCASRGNANNTIANYPASLANAIAVGALSPCNNRKTTTTCDGEFWWGSSYGNDLDVMAPGTRIHTTDITGSGGYAAGDYYSAFNGTSAACPFVAGIAALLRSSEPGLSNEDIRDRLNTTAVDINAAGFDNQTGWGRVDAAAALSAGGNASPTAEANGPYSADINVSISFSSAGSSDSDGSISSYSWDFGDGGTSTAANPSYSYTAAGTYTATLTVTDNDGATGTDDATVTITDPGGSGNYATLPYSTGFESGSLDQYWTTASTGNGRVRLLTTNSPYAGSYHLTMDDPTNGGFTRNEAWLHLDLSGETEVDLDFWWKEFGDETHNQDGIYFSDDDGANFTKVRDLTGSSTANNTWQQISMDLDALASTNGLNLTATFVVKFQQYDNYPIAVDGFAFDEISVTVGTTGGNYITAESEPNGGSSTANGPVGDGTDVTGTISSSTDNDVFYFDVNTSGNINISVAIDNTADLDWYLYHESNLSSWVARGYTVNNPESGTYNATTTGRYYVLVDGYQGASGGYTLSVTGGLAKYMAGIEKPDDVKKTDDVGNALPIIYSLEQNYPNPFNPTTSIEVALPQDSKVQVSIFDISGRLINTLVSGERTAGIHTIQWDGRSDIGESVSSGIYLYRMTATPVEGGDVFTQTRQMVFMK